MDTTGHLATITARNLTIAEVKGELANGRPIGARVEWTDRTGHFLALVGCFVGASGDAYLDVSDPIYLESQILFRDVAASYQTGASWAPSYFTTGAARGGAALAMNRPQTPLHPDAIGA